nr:ATP-binding protein [Kineosporia babensis]
MAEPRRRVELVCTELVGNALRHGRPPVRVELASTATHWLITVQDAAPQEHPVLGSPVAEQIGGRGLAIVLALSSQAGWYVEGPSKTVWAEIPDLPPEELLRRLKLSSA